jgi:hypothetical protein
VCKKGTRTKINSNSLFILRSKRFLNQEIVIQKHNDGENEELVYIYMGDYSESIVSLSLDNSTYDSQDNSYLPDFQLKLPHFFPLPHQHLSMKEGSLFCFVCIYEIHQTGMLQVTVLVSLDIETGF